MTRRTYKSLRIAILLGLALGCFIGDSRAADYYRCHNELCKDSFCKTDLTFQCYNFCQGFNTKEPKNTNIVQCISHQKGSLITQLQNQVQGLQQQAAQDILRVQNHLNTINTRDLTIQGHVTTIGGLRNLSQNLQNQANQLTNQLKQEQQKNQPLQQDLLTKKTTIQRLQEIIRNLGAESIKQGADLKQLGEDLESKKKELDKANKEVEVLGQRLKDQDKEMLEMVDYFNDFIAKYNKTMGTLEGANEKLKGALKEVEKISQKNLEEMKKFTGVLDKNQQDIEKFYEENWDKIQEMMNEALMAQNLLLEQIGKTSKDHLGKFNDQVKNEAEKLLKNMNDLLT